ncbi:MAG: hypothetical protein ACFFG0_05495 [Candidatus Thorarchaeota archaeon]
MKKISISIPDELEKQIRERAGKNTPFSTQIQNDLDIYYDSLIKESYKEMKDYFEYKEALLLCDVMNGHLYNFKQISFEIKGIAWKLEGVDQKWEVDKNQLLEKVEKLSLSQGIWLIDIIRKFWNVGKIERDKEEIKKMFNITK